MKRRAERLRRTLEQLGGAAVKLGQQLSLRRDVLPDVYCDEFDKLLDESLEGIPEELIRKTFEAEVGPLDSVFSWYDFQNSIGKASIGCVYKARLWNGKMVAVKVKRPAIEMTVVKDLKVFGGVVKFLEFLTILKDGLVNSFRDEMGKMLTEELDWRKEIRYQELFRKFHNRKKKLGVTAPKVYAQYSGPSVIVSEYIVGVPVKTILKAIEENDLTTLACLEYVNIDPKTVAKRLVRGCFYAFFECPFYHGDPHPGNIIAQPGNRVVMLDFGACGVFANRERRILRQMYEFQGRGDVGGMVQCVVKLADPLPPIDVNAFTNDLEDYYWHGYYGILSKNAAWWERTSYRLWVGLLKVVREYEVPMPLNTLRMIRATLLYDTVAARLYPRINVFKEYRKYYEKYAERVKRDTMKSVARQAITGPDPEYFVLANEAFQTGTFLLFRLRQLLDMPFPNFSALTSRVVDFFRRLTSMVVWGLVWTSLAIGLVAVTGGSSSQTLWQKLVSAPDLLWVEMTTQGASLAEGIFAVWLFIVLFVVFRMAMKTRERIGEKDMHLN